MRRNRKLNEALLAGPVLGASRLLQERNMSYCRFENTYKDLQDCYDNWYGDDAYPEDDYEARDKDLSSTEANYRKRLYELCLEIVDTYGDDYDEGNF